MRKVAVLMSTYNGEKYIEEQIDSIFNQIGVEIKLYIRDDGSYDSTLQIIEKLKQKYLDRIKLFKGKNIGPAKSFIELVFCNIKADYYAFSDQDDIWMPNKILKAIEKLEQNRNNTCNLYYSAVKQIDDNLNDLGTDIHSFKESFEISLYISAFPGCTMVFNEATMKLLRLHKPCELVMHDQWVFQLVSGVGGDICCDHESYINYRIHANNVSNFTIKRKIKKLLSEFFKNKNIRLKALKELQKLYGPYLLTEKHEYLNMLCNYKTLKIGKRIYLGIGLFDDFRYKMMLSLSLLFKVF